MARQAVAIVKSYGYKGGYYEEGQIIELAPGEKVPEYFKLLDGKEPEPEAEAQSPVTLSDMGNHELIEEALSRGIKEAKLLNQDELLKVLEKDTSKEEIEKIVAGAKGRIKPKIKPKPVKKQ